MFYAVKDDNPNYQEYNLAGHYFYINSMNYVIMIFIILALYSVSRSEKLASQTFDVKQVESIVLEYPK